jgi:SPX domain protein involved in polyphosphate accumulation
VHPENLLEVESIILRRLPVLVYNPQTSKIANGSEPDPTVTSIYFDNEKFGLYSEKAASDADVSSLRLH